MKRQALIVVVLFLFLVGVVSGFAQQTTSSQPPPLHMGFPPPPASVCTDGKYLYVLMGPRILQYSIPDLTLQNTVELPRPTPPGNK